jgi:hypothetical protein
MEFFFFFNIAHGALKDGAQLKYLVSAITGKDLIEEEMKKRLKPGNAPQSNLSSRLVSNIAEIRI